MRRLTPTLTATAAMVLVLAASAGLDVPGARAASRAPARSAAGAATRGNRGPSCNLVSPGEIKAVLGVTVTKPSVTADGPVTVCTYTGAKVLLVRFETGMSSADFAEARKGFDANGESTKSFTGLHLPAYSSVLGSGRFATSTLAVLKGSTELLVTGPFPLTKLVGLVEKTLPAM